MADYLGMGEQTSFPTQLLGQQRAVAEIAQTRAQTEHQLATSDYLREMTRETKARADTAALEFDVNKKIADLAANTPNDGEPVDPIEQLATTAGIYAKSGLVKKGADLLKVASEASARQAQSTASLLTANANAQDKLAKRLTRYTNMLGNVTDQAGWDTVRETILAEDPSARNFLAKMGDFDPRKVQALQQSLISYKDRVAAEQQERRNDIYEKSVNQRNANAQMTNEIRARRAAIEDFKARRSTKTGGKQAGDKPAGTPTKAETDVVKLQLKNLNVPADDMDAAEVAQQARIIWKSNPGVTQAEAASQVIQKMIAAGDIKPGQPAEKGFMGIGKKPASGRMFSKTRPAALPSKLEDAVVGQYYITAKGLHKYLGNDKFQPVGDAAAGDDDEDE